jgi:hypothetical protein
MIRLKCKLTGHSSNRMWLQHGQNSMRHQTCSQTAHFAPDMLHMSISILQDRYGPFEPNRVVEVPTWLALQLHKRNKARILVPAWLTSDSLDGRCCLMLAYM